MKKVQVLAVFVAGSLLGYSAPLPLAHASGSDKPAAQSDTSKEDSSQKKNESAQKDESSQKSESAEAFLGIAVGPLTPAMRSHLPTVVNKGQGVVVDEVADGSPAAKAGLQQFDVLTTFDDQRLYSPEQLVRLVQAENPGKTASLGVIRAGKEQTVQVALGSVKEHEASAGSLNPAHGTAHHGRLSQRMHAPRGFVGAHHRQGNADWERFDSMTLQKTGKDEFKVTIKYLDQNEKMQEHEFTGTRDEIHKKIQGEKDLPHSERAQLLRSLDLEEHPSAFSGIRFIPGEGLVIDLDQFGPSQQQNEPEQGSQF